MATSIVEEEEVPNYNIPTLGENNSADLLDGAVGSPTAAVDLQAAVAARPPAVSTRRLVAPVLSVCAPSSPP